MTEREFHAARRMFFVRHGTVVVAPDTHPYTHAEWIMGMLGEATGREWLRQYTRGYYLDKRLVLYKGEDFSHRVDVVDVVPALDLFHRMYGVDEVGFGATPGPTQPWEPKVLKVAADYTMFAATVIAGQRFLENLRKK